MFKVAIQVIDVAMLIIVQSCYISDDQFAMKVMINVQSCHISDDQCCHEGDDQCSILPYK